MTYNRLFLDSDVILDLLAERHPFAEYTKLLFLKCEKQKIVIKTSALIIANINYFVIKKYGKSIAKAKIKDLVEWVEILPFEKDAINFALNSNFTDFEDAIQHFVAQKFDCDLIITRNIKDYKYSTMPVFTTEQFLREII